MGGGLSLDLSKNRRPWRSKHSMVSWLLIAIEEMMRLEKETSLLCFAKMGMKKGDNAIGEKMWRDALVSGDLFFFLVFPLC